MPDDEWLLILAAQIKEEVMIKFVIGNIFESGADCLINTVNCEGFMGKGIAYQFKMRFPEKNRDYVKACKTGNLRIGTIHYYKKLQLIEDKYTFLIYEPSISDKAEKTKNIQL